MTKKFTSTVTGASLLLISVNLLSRGFGFIREVIFAGKFGLTENFDLYLVGAVLPVTINTAFLYFAQNYFIPLYHKIDSENSAVKTRFTTRSFWLYTLIGLFVALIIFVMRDVIIENYLWQSTAEIQFTAQKVLTIFLLTIPVNAIFSILSAYMQAEFDFFAPAISQLFLNIVVIALVIFFSGSQGIMIIPIAYLAGYAVQMLFVFFTAVRNLKFNPFKFQSAVKFNFSISASIGFIIFIEIINQLHLIIDRYFINFVDTGGISALNYATVLYTMPISIFSIAVATAIFPAISKNFNSGNSEELSSQFERGVRLLFFAFIPLSIVYWFWGDAIVSLIFQRGEFTGNDAAKTFGVLKMYTLSLTFYAAYAIVNKMIFTANLLKHLLVLSVVIILVKIAGNFLLVPVFKQDGLALSSSIAYFILSFAGYFIIISKLKFKVSRSLLSALFIFLINGMTSAAVVILLSELIGFGGIAKSICMIIFFSALYYFNTQFLRAEEYFFFKSIIDKLIGRGK